jgi:hypothetical protein
MREINRAGISKSSSEIKKNIYGRNNKQNAIEPVKHSPMPRN